MEIGRMMRGCVLTCLVISIVGCAEPPTQSEPVLDSAASEEPPTASDGPVTTTGNDKLLSGAGPVDADAADAFMETGSGLKYRILRKSDGQQATAEDSVTVNYRGWLDDGSEFDSSYDGEPISFPLTRVIAGWTEGMQLVGKGGMIELWIPPDLGYGSRGAPGAVPPNATLHFVVELLEVN